VQPLKKSWPWRPLGEEENWLKKSKSKKPKRSLAAAEAQYHATCEKLATYRRLKAEISCMTSGSESRKSKRPENLVYQPMKLRVKSRLIMAAAKPVAVSEMIIGENQAAL